MTRRRIESVFNRDGSLKSDSATTQSAKPSSPKQPGTERLNALLQQLLEVERELRGAGILGENSSRFADLESIDEARTRSIEEGCNALQATLTALKESPVLKTGANVSLSKGLRTCLYARELEFRDKACRTAFKRAGETIRSGQRAGDESGIRGLIEELGQSGSCPKTRSLLQGNGIGTAKPLLTLKRSADVSQTQGLKNVLNDYINVQYHINLSMIPEKEARDLQTRIGRAESRTDNESVDSLNQRVRSSGTVSIASTGETARNNISQVELDLTLDTALENAEEALYKQTNATEIQSNLAELASLWNESGDLTNILETGRFAELSRRTAQLAAQELSTREQELAAVTNAVQRGELPEVTSNETVDVSNRNYYNIKSLKINNVHGATYTDPFISNLISMEMVIVEPHGLKLHEDLINIKSKLGYETVNPGRILYKIDVWFSGYDPQSGSWVETIPINNGRSSDKQMVSFYVVLSGMEASFDVVGTEYRMTFVPQGLQAVRPEEFSLEGTTIPTGEDPTLGSFLKNLSNALRKKRSDETKEELGGSGLSREYKFYAPEAIMNAPFYQGEFLQRNNLTSEDPKKGLFVTIGKDVDILTLLRSALSDLPEVQTAFLTGNDNADFTKPVVHFTVRFNVKYTSAKPEIYDYDGIIYEFIIEPFLTFKKLGYDAETIKNYTKPEAQAARVRRMMELGMVQKVYDYINTSSNTEVLNFDIKLNGFYYESFKRSFDPGARKGKQTAAEPGKIESASNLLGLNRELEVNLVLNEDPQVRQRYQPPEDSSLQRLFGKGNDNQDGEGLEHIGEPSQVSGNRIIQGGLGTTNDPVSYGSTTSDGSITKVKDEYMYRFNDHFSLDLLTLDSLQLRGDPVWLMSPYSSSNNNALLSVPAIDADQSIVDGLLQPHTEKVIFLNIKDTKQYDFMEPDRFKGETKRNPTIMAGFYGVTESENVFEGGKFTQTLKGYKMAHLNYVGEQMDIERLSEVSGSSDPSGVSDREATSEWISQVLDQASKLPQFSTELSEYREQQKTKPRQKTEYIPEEEFIGGA